MQGVGSTSSSTTALVPMFTQPGSSTSFYDLVREKKVCLENAFMEDPTTIRGVVRVLNISFHKAVGVRWTRNDWSTQNDIQATYIDGSSDGVTDKFSFRLRLGFLPVGSRVQFCLRFDSSGSEYWDNNGGANYVFQVNWILTDLRPKLLNFESVKKTQQQSFISYRRTQLILSNYFLICSGRIFSFLLNSRSFI